MSAIINVKNLVYAKIINETLNTYGTPKVISPMMSVKVDTKTSNEILYGDGVPQETATTVGETTIEAGVNEFPQDVHADLLGHTHDPLTGVMSEKDTDEAPYVALGFQLVKSNGSSVYFWYLKGKFEEPAVDAKQKEDKVSYSTPTLKGTFVNRQDGFKRYKLDEDAGTAIPADFLGSVYSPTLDLVAPTLTSVPADAATAVVGTANLVLTFNKAIQPSTVTASNIFVMKSDGTAVPATLSINALNTIVTIDPAATLSTGSYDLVVTTNVKNLAGVPLAANYVANFTV